MDVLVLADIYPAGETPIDGVSAEHLAQAVSKAVAGTGRQTVYCGDVSRVPERVLSLEKAGDVVLTMGAGSIGRAATQLAQAKKA